MSSLALDTAKSAIVVRTYAEGMLARMAHDLELDVRLASGSATLEGEPGPAAAGKGSLVVDVDAIRVRGVLKKGHLEESVLSESDKAQILEKIREDVLGASGKGARIEIEASLAGGQVEAQVKLPRGATMKARTTAKLTGDGAAFRLAASFRVTVSSLGAKPVKGPMGAFRVRDEIEIDAALVFAPA